MNARVLLNESLEFTQKQQHDNKHDSLLGPRQKALRLRMRGFNKNILKRMNNVGFVPSSLFTSRIHVSTRSAGEMGTRFALQASASSSSQLVLSNTQT